MFIATQNIKISLFFFVTIYIISILATDINYVSSVYHLESLMRYEFGLFDIFAKHQHDVGLESINRLLLEHNELVLNYSRPEKWKSGHQEDLQDPLTIYLLIRRHSVDVPSVMKGLTETHPHSTIRSLIYNHMEKYKHDNMRLPNRDDLEDAMMAIIRIKQTYKLSIEHFVEPNALFQSTLNPTHVYEIGICAYERKMFTHAVEFLYEGIQKMNLLAQKRNFLNEIIRKHDLSLRRKRTSRTKELNPLNLISYFFTDYLVDIDSETFQKRTPEKIYPKLNVMDDYEATISAFESLCRGEVLKKNTRVLPKCFYSQPNLYHTLCPVKIEELHTNPLIIQIHDVLTENQIEELLQEAKPNMIQSKVSGVSKGTESSATKSYARTSANTPIRDDLPNSKFYHVCMKVQMITGLNTIKKDSAEVLQIASYTPGAYYFPHTDNLFEMPLLKELEESQIFQGDRLATFMIYLSDVSRGGSTAFPVLGVEAKPVKGSALFWYNENPDGSVNHKMLHGGCPVLHGIKIIANKWIRSHNQMFIRQCPR